MKNLLLGLMMLAGTSMAFANETNEKVTEKKQEEVVTKCYKKCKDDFGNVYYAQIDCPKVIIFKAVEEIEG
jgi:hypothetical protein